MAKNGEDIGRIDCLYGISNFEKSVGDTDLLRAFIVRKIRFGFDQS